jgi:biopolymer transport protein TolR
MWSPSQAAVLRAASRRPSVRPSIDPMPFLGVFVVLLFLLMISTPTRHERGSIPLPEAPHATSYPRALRADAIRIAITRDGKVFFGYLQVSPGQLPGIIRTALRQGAERNVYLIVDRKAKYADVKVVIDQFRLGGVTDVVILAQKPTQ